MSAKFAAWLLLAVTASTLAQSTVPNSVRGTVTSSDGKLLQGVVVYPTDKRECCTSQADRTETDVNGAFQFDGNPKVLHFFKGGFAPASRVVPSGAAELNVVMEDDASTRWLLPPCTGKRNRKKEIGWPYQIRLRKRGKVRRKFHANSISYLILDRRKEYVLSIQTGTLLGGLDADDDWLLKAASFTERSITDGTNLAGQDFRGTDREGKAWRWVGFSGYTLARYRGVPPDVAKYFDQIIESACVVSDIPTR